MAEAGSPGGRVPAQWRKQAGSGRREAGSNRLLKLVALGSAVAIVGALIIWLLWTGPPRTPPSAVLHAAVVGNYVDLQVDGTLRASLAPTPWLINDAEQFKSLPPRIRYATKNWKIIQARTPLRDALRAALHLDKPPAPEGKAGELQESVIVYLAAVGALREDKLFFVANDWATGESWGLELKDVLDLFEQSPLKNKLLLLNWASPRPQWIAGPAEQASVPQDDGRFATELHKYLAQRKPKFPIITACSSGEESLPLPVEGRSVFGYFVARGLGGLAARVDGQHSLELRVSHLANYLQREVDRWAQDNEGRRQKPQTYGLDNNFVLVAHVPEADSIPLIPEPEPTKPESTAGPNEKTPVKDPKEAERLRLTRLEELNRPILEESLGGKDEFRLWEEGWKKVHEWSYPLDGTPAQHEATELELAQGTVRKLVHTLRRYEDTLLLYHGKSGNDYPGHAMVEPVRLRFASECQEHLALLTQLARFRIDRDRSLAGLWFDWTPDDKLVQRLTRELRPRLAPPAPGQPDAKAKLDEFIKAESKQHWKELLYICWKGLTEEELTKDKAQLLRALIEQLVQEHRPEHRQRELVVLQRISDYLSKPTNLLPGDKLEELILRAAQLFLLIEHRDEQIAQALLPIGRTFVTHQKQLESLHQQFDALIEKFRKMTPPGTTKLEIRGDELKDDILPKLTGLEQEYRRLYESIAAERVTYEAWTEAQAQIQATAILALAESEETFNRRWVAWVQTAEAVGHAAQDGASPSSPGHLDAMREKIKTLRTARQLYYEQSLGGPAVATFLLQVEKQVAEDALTVDALKALQRLLEGVYLAPPERARLFAGLVKGRQKLHLRSLKLADQKADERPLPAALGPTDKRHEDVATNLKKLPPPADATTLLPRRRQEARTLLVWLARRHQQLATARNEIDGARKYHQDTAEAYQAAADRLTP